METVHDYINELETINRKLIIENTELKERLLQTPKPPTPPVGDGLLLIRKDSIQNANICSIVKDDTPGAKQNEMTRQVLKIAQSVGCNMWTGFFNEFELNLTAYSGLVAYGHSLGLAFGADTVDAMHEIIYRGADDDINDARFKKYIEDLIKLGAVMLIVNDADGKNKDGTLRYPAPYLKRMVQRIKTAASAYPEIPVMASLTAGADPKAYKAEYGFDLVEAQTFGTISELTSFLKRGFDVYCLDAQKSSSVKYLQQARAVLLKEKPKAIRWYAGFDYGGTDWRAMPTQVKEITETSKQLKAALSI